MHVGVSVCAGECSVVAREWHERTGRGSSSCRDARLHGSCTWLGTWPRTGAARASTRAIQALGVFLLVGGVGRWHVGACRFEAGGGCPGGEEVESVLAG